MVVFPPLLTPLYWERAGNVPPLTRLLQVGASSEAGERRLDPPAGAARLRGGHPRSRPCWPATHEAPSYPRHLLCPPPCRWQAYLAKAGPDIVSGGHLLAILGVFQKLIASKVRSCIRGKGAGTRAPPRDWAGSGAASPTTDPHRPCARPANTCHNQREACIKERTTCAASSPWAPLCAASRPPPSLTTPPPSRQRPRSQPSRPLTPRRTQANDVYGFQLLGSIVRDLPQEAYAQYMPTVWQLVFTRLQVGSGGWACGSLGAHLKHACCRLGTSRRPPANGRTQLARNHGRPPT